MPMAFISGAGLLASVGSSLLGGQGSSTSGAGSPAVSNATSYSQDVGGYNNAQQAADALALGQNQYANPAGVAQDYNNLIGGIQTGQATMTNAAGTGLANTMIGNSAQDQQIGNEMLSLGMSGALLPSEQAIINGLVGSGMASNNTTMGTLGLGSSTMAASGANSVSQLGASTAAQLDSQLITEGQGMLGQATAAGATGVQAVNAGTSAGAAEMAGLTSQQQTGIAADVAMADIGLGQAGAAGSFLTASTGGQNANVNQQAQNLSSQNALGTSLSNFGSSLGYGKVPGGSGSYAGS